MEIASGHVDDANLEEQQEDSVYVDAVEEPEVGEDVAVEEEEVEEEDDDEDEEEGRTRGRFRSERPSAEIKMRRTDNFIPDSLGQPANFSQQRTEVHKSLNFDFLL